jgi:hypothetical protein
MYIHTFIVQIYVHTYIHTCIQTYTCKHTHVYMYIGPFLTSIKSLSNSFNGVTATIIEVKPYIVSSKSTTFAPSSSPTVVFVHTFINIYMYLYIYIYICVYMYVYIYMYIYMNTVFAPSSSPTVIFVYLYILSTYIYMCIYIYIHFILNQYKWSQNVSVQTCDIPFLAMECNDPIHRFFMLSFCHIFWARSVRQRRTYREWIL